MMNGTWLNRSYFTIRDIIYKRTIYTSNDIQVKCYCCTWQGGNLDRPLGDKGKDLIPTYLSLKRQGIPRRWAIISNWTLNLQIIIDFQNVDNADAWMQTQVSSKCVTYLKWDRCWGLVEEDSKTLQETWYCILLCTGRWWKQWTGRWWREWTGRWWSLWTGSRWRLWKCSWWRLDRQMVKTGQADGENCGQIDDEDWTDRRWRLDR